MRNDRGKYLEMDGFKIPDDFLLKNGSAERILDLQNKDDINVVEHSLATDNYTPEQRKKIEQALNPVKQKAIKAKSNKNRLGLKIKPELEILVKDIQDTVEQIRKIGGIEII